VQVEAATRQADARQMELLEWQAMRQAEQEAIVGVCKQARQKW